MATFAELLSRHGTPGISLAAHLADLAKHITAFPIIVPESNDAPRIQRAIEWCEENDKALYFPNGTYTCSSNGLTISDGIKIFGESKENCILDFAGLAAGSAISIAKDSVITNLYIGFMYIKGNTSITAFDIGTDITTALTDSQFQQLYVKTFALGIISVYAWMNTWTNCRFQNCTKPFSFNNQTNATHFDTCSFVTFSTKGDFSNCEGIIFTNPNISNITVDNAMTLFQSTVIMNNPYFENVQDIIATVGTSSEVIGSSLSINGGIISGAVVAGNNNVSIAVNGSRVTGNGFEIRNAASATPTKFTRNMIVNLKDTNFDNKNVTVLDYEYNERVTFAGASGGSTRFFVVYRDYTTFEQQAAANGIIISAGLTNGTQYTLVYAVRKKADVTAIGAQIDSGQSLSILGALQDDTEDWEIRYMPFISSGTTLKWLFTGTLEVKMIKIFKGLINTDLHLPSGIKAWYTTAAPTVGTWAVKDRVYNIVPAVGQPKSWVCTEAGAPGTWVSEGNL
jgi:hypothetical protein